MRIAIYGKIYKPEYQSSQQLLFDELYNSQIEIVILESFLEKIKPYIKISMPYSRFSSHEDIVGKVDFLFSIGGDGTLLDTIKYVRNSEIPILGINLGRMGFLSSISINQIRETLHQIRLGHYNIEKRAVLRLEKPDDLFGEMNYALNELSIIRSASEGMLTIKTYINGDYMNTYWGDGLIVATPTGSTAYSLSNNGPIILPGSQNLVITPVATHNLTVRPFVIPDNYEIKIKVEGRVNNYCISLDSRSVELHKDIELIIKKETFFVNLLQLKNENFFKTIRKKLMWGLDIRN